MVEAKGRSRSRREVAELLALLALLPFTRSSTRSSRSPSLITPHTVDVASSELYNSFSCVASRTLIVASRCSV